MGTRLQAKITETLHHFLNDLWLFQGEKLGLGSLFGSRLVATNTIVMCINWIVTNLCYYGLILHSVDLAGRYDHYDTIRLGETSLILWSGNKKVIERPLKRNYDSEHTWANSSNIYANFSLSAAIEIPSYVFAVLVIDRIGRKPLLIFCQILAGVTCIVAGFEADHYGLVLAMTLLGSDFCLSLQTCKLWWHLFCPFRQVRSQRVFCHRLPLHRRTLSNWTSGVRCDH